MRESTIIYRSFYEAIKELPKKNRAEIWDAIFEYSLNFKEIEISKLSKTIFTLIKPQLDANIKRYKNGTQAKAKQDESETEAKDKQTISETEANLNPNVNVNDTLNFNLNENDNPLGVLENSETQENLKTEFKEKKNNFPGAGEKPKPKEKTDINSKMVKAWYEYHLKLKGLKPSAYSGADAAAMKKIRERIIALIPEKTEERILEFWQIILDQLPKKNQWLSTQPLLVINSHFDTAITNIKNGKSKSGFNTKSELDAAVEELYRKK